MKEKDEIVIDLFKKIQGDVEFHISFIGRQNI